MSFQPLAAASSHFPVFYIHFLTDTAVFHPPLSVFLLSDRHQRELPDHVGHYLQSLTPPASCDSHQDRLEQDPELQDRQRDAECLTSREDNRQAPPPRAPSPPNNVA